MVVLSPHRTQRAQRRDQVPFVFVFFCVLGASAVNNGTHPPSRVRLPARAPARTIATVMYSRPVAAWMARPRGQSWQQTRAAMVTPTGKIVIAAKPPHRKSASFGPNVGA